MNKEDFLAISVGETLYLNVSEQILSSNELNEYSIPLKVVQINEHHLIGRNMNSAKCYDIDETKIADISIDALYEIKDKPYHFRKGDKVIVLNTSDNSFSIYANVLNVDKKENIITLEKFQKEGSLYLGEFIHRLDDMEKGNYYFPMTPEEKYTFDKNKPETYNRKLYRTNGNGKLIKE